MPATKTPDKPDESEEETADAEDVFAFGASSVVNGIKAIMTELENLGGCYSDLTYLSKNEGIARQVAKILIEARSGDKATQFPIEVDYGLSLERLIMIANFDQVNTEEILKYKFASPDKGKANLVATMLSFNQLVTIDEVQKEINSRTDGSRPANAKELVVFTTESKETQLGRAIFALGSPVVEGEKTVVLCATSEESATEESGKNKKRVLCAEAIVSQFGPTDVFLLVKPAEDKPLAS